jgi:DNA-binding LytR/AlgR family response regulator
MLIACVIVSGLDRKALAMFEIALLAAAAATVPALMRRGPQAIVLAAAAVLLTIWAHSAGPNFLDTGYYLTAAGVAVALGVAAVLRPVRAVEVPAPSAAGERTIAFRDGARHHLLVPSRIAFVKADDDYCTFHMVDGREVTVTMALKATLALLPPDFLRIHRSHAINLRHLSGILPGPNGRIAKLAEGTILPIGRTYVADLHALIANMDAVSRP